MILLLVAGSFVTWVQPETGPVVGFLGLVLGLSVACALFVRRSRTLARPERAAWSVIGLGVALMAMGVAVFGILTEVGIEIAAFGPFDVFFLGGYGALIVAFYRLARLDGEGRDWLVTSLDAAVGGIALAALVWTAFFHDFVESLVGTNWWEAAIGISYPVLDMAAVIGLMILVIRRSHYYLDLRLVCFALGLSAQVMADFIFLSRSIGQAFVDVQPAYPLNLLATALILATAAIVDRTPRKREFPESPTPMWAIMWPYLLAALLLFVHIARYRSLGPSPDELLVLDAVIAIGVVIFLRQVFVIHRDRVRVDRQRSELVASVSHELRTPLTAMLGFLTILNNDAEEFPEDARKEMISEATDQARHMSRLVSDLLMLAKGDHSQLALEIEDVSISSMVTGAMRSVDTENTRVEELLENDAKVRVDPDRLKQALANLLSNAVRYGGERAQVIGRLEGRDLVLELHDNGSGVPTRYETIIWQRFERGAHRLDATTPGLGIGLAIVHAVAASHGGYAQYRDSERLGGACFSIVIPGCVATQSEPASVHASS